VRRRPAERGRAETCEQERERAQLAVKRAGVAHRRPLLEIV
jgi:hypothetical protein